MSITVIKMNICKYWLILTFLFLFRMPKNARVIISYGPYNACTLTDHRTNRLRGLINQLESNGHTVTLDQVSHRDACNLTVNGEVIFNCNITNLDFGGDGLLDPLCHDAIKGEYHFLVEKS